MATLSTLFESTYSVWSLIFSSFNLKCRFKVYFNETLRKNWKTWFKLKKLPFVKLLLHEFDYLKLFWLHFWISSVTSEFKFFGFPLKNEIVNCVRDTLGSFRISLSSLTLFLRKLQSSSQWKVISTLPGSFRRLEAPWCLKRILQSRFYFEFQMFEMRENMISDFLQMIQKLNCPFNKKNYYCHWPIRES